MAAHGGGDEWYATCLFHFRDDRCDDLLQVSDASTADANGYVHARGKFPPDLFPRKLLAHGCRNILNGITFELLLYAEHSGVIDLKAAIDCDLNVIQHGLLL